MAKSQPFTLDDLEKKGYVKQLDGSWAKPSRDYEKAVEIVKKSIKTNGKVIIYGDNDKPIIPLETGFIPPIISTLTIDGIIAGLNNKGLMDTHWSKRKKQKDLYRQIIRDQLKAGKIRQHEGKVKVQYIGYKSSFMDWDNFASSAKYPMDGLVKEKIILDDNPNVVIEFLPKQIKCKRIDQKVIIIITDVV